ncbi:MAG: hypothetical protein HRU20_01860 [Pseudomonadales bacterium]|nr:hypothetical protein [Pseudomonadales bacterium]
MSLYPISSFVAHRGLRHRWPENSLPGIEAAIISGATNVEVDVQFSRDGIALLYHDHDLKRISAQQGTVADFNWSELQRFKAHEPERLGDKYVDVLLQRLSALLELVLKYPDVHFYIELKRQVMLDHSRDFCLQQIADIFQSAMGQITLISFDTLAVKLAKQDYGFQATGVVLSQWQTREQVIEETCADIAYINLKKIPESDVISASCPLVVYEIADVDLALKTLQRGADKIETFVIDKLLQALCLRQDSDPS